MTIKEGKRQRALEFLRDKCKGSPDELVYMTPQTAKVLLRWLEELLQNVEK